MKFLLTRKMKKTLVIYMVVLALVLMTAKLYYRPSRRRESKFREMELEVIRLRRQLETATAKIQKLEIANRANAREWTNSKQNTVQCVNQYQPKYEKIYRRLGNLLQELGFFTKSGLKELSDRFEGAEPIKAFADSVSEQIRILRAVHRQLSDYDGYESARSAESKRVRDLVDKQFSENNLQCDRRVRCNLKKSCGFGCQLHHLAYCSAFAYFTQRKLVIDAVSWSYGEGEFNKIFEALPGETCPEGVHYDFWSGDLSKDYIQLPIIDSIQPRPAFLPLSIPDSLARNTEILSLHGNPFVLFIGHLMKHLLRLKSPARDLLEERRRQVNFTMPIVGIHVRRTDKIGTEASFHHLDEYMAHVEDFFDVEEKRLGRQIKRRVFIASDEPNILNEAKNKYPEYEFIFNAKSAESGGVDRRYSKDSVVNLVIDMLLLSECDYLVCTFSSQVCRVAYEILQTRHVDGSWRFRSLDDIYYFGGQHAHNYRAMMNHSAANRDQISLIEGDVLGIAGNHWNGFCKGLNRRTNQQGLFPSYKAEDVVRISD